MSAPNSRFIRACRCEPVDVTPIWLMRQAGRYMAEYRAVRKKHSILEICKTPEIAADITITAAEKLGDDLRLRFTSQTGYLYNLQARADLATGFWVNIRKAIPSGGTATEVTLTNALLGAQQFYCIQQLP